MIKAKHFVPVTEYHDHLNKQVLQRKVTSSHPNVLHAQHVPSSSNQTSWTSRAIERRPTNVQSQTKRRPENVAHAETGSKQYELFPTNKDQYELFPATSSNAQQHQHNQNKNSNNVIGRRQKARK